MANPLTVEYVPTQWVDGTAPAINAVHLNHIETGILNVTDDLIVLETQVNDNEADITTLETSMTAVEGRVTTLEGEVATNTANIAVNAADIVTNAGDIATNVTNIANLQTEVDNTPSGDWTFDGTTLFITVA